MKWPLEKCGICKNDQLENKRRHILVRRNNQQKFNKIVSGLKKVEEKYFFTVDTRN